MDTFEWLNAMSEMLAAVMAPSLERASITWRGKICDRHYEEQAEFRKILKAGREGEQSKYWGLSQW